MKKFLCFLFLHSLVWASGPKVLICGVGKNIETAAQNSIKNIEMLGTFFSDWKAIIYENNSTDRTPLIFSEWANNNKHVIFLSETLKKEELPPSRTEKIARARNIVLAKAREFPDFDLLIMVDLDFKHAWPIKEIVNVCHSKGDWDCISANGLYHGHYYDRYAFRDEKHPLGPELLNESWWLEVRAVPLSFKGNKPIPVFSAFGGLAIYKSKSILPFSYSGTVTEDLAEYYRRILFQLPKSSFHLIQYISMNNLQKCYGEKSFNNLPVYFVSNSTQDCPQNYSKVTCCEHATLHASMLLNGFGKFYINPQLVMQYE